MARIYVEPARETWPKISCKYYLFFIFPIYESQSFPYEDDKDHPDYWTNKQWRDYFSKTIQPWLRYLTRYKLIIRD